MILSETPWKGDSNELWIALDKIEEAIACFMQTESGVQADAELDAIDVAILAYVNQNTRLMAGLRERAAGVSPPAEPVVAREASGGATLSAGPSAAGRAHNPSPAAPPSTNANLPALRQMYEDPAWAVNVAEGLFRRLLELAPLINANTITTLLDQGHESLSPVQVRALCAIELKARGLIESVVRDLRSSTLAVASADHDEARMELPADARCPVCNAHPQEGAPVYMFASVPPILATKCRCGEVFQVARARPIPNKS